MTRAALRLAAVAVLCAALAACTGDSGGSPPPPPGPESPAGGSPVATGDPLFFFQTPAFAPNPLTPLMTREPEAAEFRGWFAASPELWSATAALSEPLNGEAIVALVRPVGCDTVGGAALELRDARYELGLRDVVRHRECLVAHQAVAAFRVPRPREPVVAPPLGPGGDPAVYVRTSGRPSATEIDSLDDLAGARYDDLRETIASRLTAGTRVFAFVVEACDAPGPRLIVTPTTLRVAGGCPGQPSYLAVFAVPDRFVPAGARPV